MKRGRETYHLGEETAVELLTRLLDDTDTDLTARAVAHENDAVHVKVVLLVMRHHVLGMRNGEKRNEKTIVAVVLCRGMTVLRSKTVVDVGDDTVGFESILTDDTLRCPAIRHEPASAMTEEDELAGLLLVIEN